MNDRKDKAPQILNTFATLPGLCFIVLTSLKVSNRTADIVIDKLTVFAITIFVTSGVMIFLSA